MNGALRSKGSTVSSITQDSRSVDSYELKLLIALEIVVGNMQSGYFEH